MSTLFTATEIKEAGYIHRNVNDDQLSVILLRTEKIDLISLIGEDMYNDLVTKRTGGTLNAYEQNLVNNYLFHFTAAAVEHRAVYALLYEFRNMTVGVTSDTQIRGLSREEVTALRDETLADVLMFAERAKKYICDNISQFPLYTSNTTTFTHPFSLL
ncbi:MAG: hypothetical protein ABIK73_08080 [candidate division WOR-3 bacterium]